MEAVGMEFARRAQGGSAPQPASASLQQPTSGHIRTLGGQGLAASSKQHCASWWTETERPLEKGIAITGSTTSGHSETPTGQGEAGSLKQQELPAGSETVGHCGTPAAQGEAGSLKQHASGVNKTGWLQVRGASVTVSQSGTPGGHCTFGSEKQQRLLLAIRMDLATGLPRLNAAFESLAAFLALN